MSRHYQANCETGLVDLFQFLKSTIFPPFTKITGLTGVDAMINESTADQEILLVWWDKSRILARQCDVSPLVG